MIGPSGLRFRISPSDCQSSGLEEEAEARLISDTIPAHNGHVELVPVAKYKRAIRFLLVPRSWTPGSWNSTSDSVCKAYARQPEWHRKPANPAYRQNKTKTPDWPVSGPKSGPISWRRLDVVVSLHLATRRWDDWTDLGISAAAHSGSAAEPKRNSRRRIKEFKALLRVGPFRTETAD